MASIKVPDLDINRSRGYQYDPRAQKRNSTLFDDLRSMNNSYLSDILNPRQSRLLKPPPRVIPPMPIPPPPPPRLLYPPPPPPPPPPIISRIIPPDIKLRQAESVIYGRPRSPPMINQVVHPPTRVYSKPIHGPPGRIIYSSPIRNPIPHHPPPHHPTPPKHHGHNIIMPTVQQNIQPGHHGDHPLPSEPDKHPPKKQEKQIQTDKENNPIPHSKSNFRDIIQHKIDQLNKLKLDSDPDHPPIDLTPLTQAKDNYIDHSQQLLHKLNDLAQDRKQQMLISKIMNYIKKDPPKQHISWPNY